MQLLSSKIKFDSKDAKEFKTKWKKPNIVTASILGNCNDKNKDHQIKSNNKLSSKN